MPASAALRAAALLSVSIAQVAHVSGIEGDRPQQPAIGDQTVPREVKARVRLDEGVGVGVAIGRFGGAQRLGDPGERLGIGDRLRHLCQRGRLEQPAQLVDLVDIRVRQDGDDEAAPLGRDQAIAFQPRERLAHRRAGDAELHGECRLLEPLPGHDHVTAEIVAQRLVHLVGEAGGPVEGFERGHRGAGTGIVRGRVGGTAGAKTYSV